MSEDFEYKPRGLVYIQSYIFFFLCCKKRKKSGSCDIVNRRDEFHFWVNYPFKAEFTSPSTQLLGPNLSLIPCQRSHLTLYTGVRPMIQLGHNTSLIAQVSLHSPDQLSKVEFFAKYNVKRTLVQNQKLNLKIFWSLGLMALCPLTCEIRVQITFFIFFNLHLLLCFGRFFYTAFKM